MALEDGPSIAEKKNDDVEKVTSNGDSHDHSEQLGRELDEQRLRVKELEERVSKQDEEKDALQKELDEVKKTAEKKDAEAEERFRQVSEERDDLSAQYRSLLDRVSTIKEKMGEKLKADAVLLPRPSLLLFLHLPRGHLRLTLYRKLYNSPGTL